MNNFFFIVNDKFHIIDEPEDRRPVFCMDIRGRIGNDRTSFLTDDHTYEDMMGIFTGASVQKRIYGVLFITALRGHTVRRVRTGGKGLVHSKEAEVSFPAQLHPSVHDVL